METIGMNEDVLSLSLSTVSHSTHVERRINNSHLLINSDDNWELKIFRLFEERQRMLNMNMKIEQKSSVTGDSGQRVAAYFADGLSARLLTQKSAFYYTQKSAFYYNMVMNKPTPAEEFMAFTHLNRVSPFYQFAHFTANQAILEAFEGEEETNNWCLHVIDYDVSHGFQWPSLMQSLSEMAANDANHRVVSLCITGLAKSLEELIGTENRLVSFSKIFHNIAFEFHGLLKGSKLKNLERRNNNETLAVNLVFHLSSLNNTSNISETMTVIHSLNPSVVVLVEREGSHHQKTSSSSCRILSNYVDSLHYYAAMFDSLDDCLPLESAERLSIEKNHLGREIKDLIIACDEDDDDEVKCLSKFEVMETWKERMMCHGFEGIVLSSKVTIQAKLLMKMGCHYHPRFEGGDAGGGSGGGGGGGGGGFRVYERDCGMGISLGWQDRFLITASAWRCI
ncbi:GRAS family protein RAM1 isoform X2 [Spinacia oleracea]|uniref:GRAS family protein RAM1 isoform X2 n=1 Tax=Spinacia oleracea TaxID=3562 RepID=A0A9R0JWE7_SPIOL|nr:GRAS family protein RAM1-like isoform X2 [Spinacia oleracea]